MNAQHLSQAEVNIAADLYNAMRHCRVILKKRNRQSTLPASSSCQKSRMEDNESLTPKEEINEAFNDKKLKDRGQLKL